MTISDNDLKEIEELAGLFLLPDEIAVLLGKDIADFCSTLKNKRSPAYLAYFKGKTSSKTAIRRNIIKMAKNGSPGAEEMVNKYCEEQDLFEF